MHTGQRARRKSEASVNEERLYNKYYETPSGSREEFFLRLDASYPWLPPKTKEEFLDAGDAALVVNLRTSFIGSHSPPGHIDFYANGGLSQPGCQKWYYPYTAQQVCNHFRAVALMIEAVKHARDRVFPACGCPDWNTFQDNTCDCHNVNNFGLYPNTSALGKFYFSTNSEPLYSRPL
ncbi:phospholipase A1 member A [Cherax quadricarinatus]|uniref:phospholipase A1 member A n=1 Tax=Cherax quadricarinatus TaxID=27406 RepID=UPI00387EBE57